MKKTAILLGAFIFLLVSVEFLYAGSYDNDDSNDRPRINDKDYYEMGLKAGNKFGTLSQGIAKYPEQRLQQRAIEAPIEVARIQAQAAVDVAQIQAAANDDLNRQKTLFAMNREKVLADYPELSDPNHPFTKIVDAVEKEYPVFLTMPDGPLKIIEIAKQRYELQQLKSNLNNQIVPTQLKVNPVPQGWEHIENWRSLREGITKEEIRALMGEPERILRAATGLESWVYGTGRIVFDSGGSVIGWDEPLKNR